MEAKRKTDDPGSKTSMVLLADRDIRIERTFRAPARIVFDAWTNPELVRRWWAPKSHGVEIAECRADVRVGGEYRYVLGRGAESMGFSGVYSEVTPHTRLVYTQVFEPMADAGAVNVTVTFEPVAGGTRVTAHEVYPSAMAREAAVSAGMEHGMRETMDQLDDLVASLH